jgi:hypothetical protein
VGDHSDLESEKHILQGQLIHSLKLFSSLSSEKQHNFKVIFGLMENSVIDNMTLVINNIVWARQTLNKASAF